MFVSGGTTAEEYRRGARVDARTLLPLPEALGDLGMFKGQVVALR